VLRPGTVGADLLAFLSVGVASGLRLAIDPYVEGLQFATFLPAVIITTLIGGFGAGLFSVVRSVAVAAFFVLPPRLSFYVEKPGDVLALLLYTVVMLFTVALITGTRVSAERRRASEMGCVDIRWDTDGDTFTMSWTECEGPPVSAPEWRGFGSIVMETMVERSLNGKVELLYPPSGVSWRLICPAANVLERNFE
jgi:hypothetical protein